MPKKKTVDTNEQGAPDVPPMPTRGREVIYSIIVPNCDDGVSMDRARRELHARQVPINKIYIDAGRGVVSVPRLVTIWQGDAAERMWQRSIQDALPGALIDVADWTPAPGYPKDEPGAKEGLSK